MEVRISIGILCIVATVWLTYKLGLKPICNRMPLDPNEYQKLPIAYKFARTGLVVS